MQAAAVPEVFLTAHDALDDPRRARPGRAGADPRGRQRGRHGGGAARPRDGLHGVRHVADGRQARAGAHASGVDVGDRHSRDDFAEVVRRETAGGGVQVVLDLLGAGRLAGNLQALGPRGRLVLVGLLGGREAPLDRPGLMLRKRLTRGRAPPCGRGRSRRRSPPPGCSPARSFPGSSAGSSGRSSTRSSLPGGARGP